MAYVDTQWCLVCQHHTQHVNDRCVSCKKRLEAQIKAYEESRRNARKHMSLEERVTELERRVDRLTTHNQ